MRFALHTTRSPPPTHTPGSSFRPILLLLRGSPALTCYVQTNNSVQPRWLLPTSSVRPLGCPTRHKRWNVPSAWRHGHVSYSPLAYPIVYATVSLPIFEVVSNDVESTPTVCYAGALIRRDAARRYPHGTSATPATTRTIKTMPHRGSMRTMMMAPSTSKDPRRADFAWWEVQCFPYSRRWSRRVVSMN